MENQVNCPLHIDRPARYALNVPCASDGKMWVCEECFNAAPDSALRGKLFEAYMLYHEKQIRSYRTADAIRAKRNN